jgi:ElaB/YqjD/DUF883 family membrane-anchored ribosome-binding protein
MSNPETTAELIRQAETLLAKVGDAATPEIRVLQTRLKDSIAEMKQGFATKANDGIDQLRDVTDSVVKYVRANPWVAVAAGTTIAVALIYAAFSSLRED